MIDVIRLSNIVVVFNKEDGSFVVLDNWKVKEGNEGDAIEENLPLFSADSLTEQERYLIKIIVDGDRLIKMTQNRARIVEENYDELKLESKRNSEEALKIIRELKSQNSAYKSEVAALQAELSDLRQSKLENREEAKVEGV